MKITILSQWYPPETEIRIHILAKYLASKGNSVVSITGFPNYPKGKIFSGYKIKLHMWEEMDKVKVLRLPLYPSHDNSAIKRIINYLSFALSASVISPFFVPMADIMWVYHPPLTIGLPALVLSRIKHMPFIYEIQDMWPETLRATGMIKNNNLLNLIAFAAKHIYSKAAAIVVISDGFKQNLIDKGVPEDKIYVIPNWTDEKIYKKQLSNENIILNENNEAYHKFILVYAGNIGKAQGLDNLIEAAKLIPSDEIIIYLIGEGLEKKQLVEKVKNENLQNIIFLDKMSPNDILKYYQIADALLIHLQRDPLFSITIPGKTFSYMAYGKPIICVAEGEVTRIIDEASCGVVVRPSDPEDLAKAILRLSKMSIDERKSMGENGIRFYDQKYSQQVLLDRYEMLFNKVNSEFH
ncbi:MAG: glycosyltransferase family 4 protein [Rectinema sp.]